MRCDPVEASPARRNELDVLRGVLLVLMALTHLPTRLSAYSSQPLGFVSAAEGFVFLSAFLVGSIYSRKLLERGAEYVKATLRRRAWKLYLAHLGLVVFFLTVVAGLAVLSGSAALHNHLAVFFARPVSASLGAPLLLYQPPLLDILPMYVIFLALTPLLLQQVRRRGWRPILAASAMVWVFAQLGGRRMLYDGVSATVGMPLPLEALGAFDWLAWQLVWIAGVSLGARRLGCEATVRSGAETWVSARVGRLSVLGVAAAVSVAFLIWRHGGFGLEAAQPPPALVDKWHLGALRIVNFAALAYFAHHAVLPCVAALRLRLLAPLAMLGRASLAVFTVHVPFCILSHGITVGSAPLSPWQEVLVLGVTLGAMLLVAWRAERRRMSGERARKGLSALVRGTA